MEKLSFIKLYHSWQYDPYSDPPLGMLTVASTARKIPNLSVDLLDQAHQKELPHADYFGISATTLEYPEALTQANKIRELYPKAKIIAGGAHFDALPDSDWNAELKDLPFDVICRGEGEATISEAIEHLRNGGGKKIINQRGNMLPIDALEMPARDLLDREKYFVHGKSFNGGNNKDSIVKEGNSSTIMTSRGCPYSCSFCASPMLHNRRLRFRSLDKVIEELEHLKSEYNITSLRWQDDNIPLNIKKFSGLVEYLKDSGIYSRGSARTDQINPQMLEKLWAAGFRELGYGIEAADQGVLDLLFKKTNVDENIAAMKLSKEYGFRVRAFIMTGLPGETKDSADVMIDFLEKSRPDVVTLTSFIPLPGSDVYMNPDKYGIKIRTKDWSKYDIAIKWDAETEWAHELSTITLEDMERNREKLKSYIFNNSISNVPVYNKPYIHSE